MTDTLYEEAIALLQKLIATPSLSQEEDETAKILIDYFDSKNILFQRSNNNVWATNKYFNPELPSILLNSHHDTVKPNAGYSRNPYLATIEDGKLFGLGTNDAGGCLVSLIATFVYFYDKKLPCNLVLVASAEEEISGKNGIESLLCKLPQFNCAIVGEPTLLRMAVAEKGLMVIDATVKGKAGHAAREEGVNAIYEALDDLITIKNFKFERPSAFLGPSKVSATIIKAGAQHNVVPDLCHYTLDVRVNDAYSLEEALEELASKLKADLVPRSLRLNSSRIDPNHPIVKAAGQLGLELFGSPTLSDQALIPYPSVKIGPGDSARSHSPDEFIFVDEIREGINLYIKLLESYFSNQ